MLNDQKTAQKQAELAAAEAKAMNAKAAVVAGAEKLKAAQEALRNERLKANQTQAKAAKAMAAVQKKLHAAEEALREERLHTNLTMPQTPAIPVPETPAQEFAMPDSLQHTGSAFCEGELRQYCVLERRPDQTGPTFVLTAILMYPLPLAAPLVMVLKNRKRYCLQHGYFLVLQTSRLGKTDTHGHGGWEKPLFIQELFKSPSTKAVFTMDMDAIVTRLDQTLESIEASVLAKRAQENREHLGLIVSGDTSIVNNGQIIYYNTPWTKAFLTDWYSFPDNVLKIADNGPFIAMMCGATSKDSHDAMRGYYDQCDQGYTNHDIEIKLRSASGNFKELMRIPDKVQDEVAWVPQRTFNAYYCDTTFPSWNPDVPMLSGQCGCNSARADEAQHHPGDFVLHFAGHGDGCRWKTIEHILRAKDLI